MDTSSGQPALARDPRDLAVHVAAFFARQEGERGADLDGLGGALPWGPLPGFFGGLAERHRNQGVQTGPGARPPWVPPVCREKWDHLEARQAKRDALCSSSDPGLSSFLMASESGCRQTTIIHQRAHQMWRG